MQLSHNLVNFAQNVLTDTYDNDVHEKKTCYMECYGYCKGHTRNTGLSKNVNVTEQSLITKQL